MPISESEIHPYLQIGEAVSASRMIIGTYPIYSLTNPRTTRKNQLQQQRGDISFFYGSQANYFWTWYRDYLDANINIQNTDSIIKSLRTNGISISDVIKACSRIDESFEDNKLRNKEWNLSLASIIEKRIDKIICTSKSSSGAMGWLIDKILVPAGFAVSKTESQNLHFEILNNILNSNKRVKPVAYTLSKEGKRVSIVSLPSPGSPVRRLSNFGYLKGVHDNSVYLDQYLKTTFGWFTANS